MISVKYANAMREVLEYLKGIREEDVDKIPQNFIEFLEKNASEEYDCKFDYKKPLEELNLMDESKGIIGLICYKYWCETEEQKQEFLNKLNENEKNFQEELRKVYNVETIFSKKEQRNIQDNEWQSKELISIDVKESKIKRICKKLVMFIKRIKN